MINHNVLHKIQDYLSQQEERKALHTGTTTTQECILSEEERGQLKSSIDSCPAFHSTVNADMTCPFKNVETTDALKEELQKIPNSHKKCPVFSEQKHELRLNREEKAIIQSLFVFRWDLFFDQPLKDMDLCKELRRKTTKKHIEAENVPFIKRFVKLDICPYQYRMYLANLWKLYETLEHALDTASPSHNLLKRIYFPNELARLESLEADLFYFYGPRWRERISILPATILYTDRILELLKDPAKHHLLIAHSSTRYLGDMYGGQHLMNKSRAALKLPENKGTKFYEFNYVRNGSAYNGSVIQFRNYFEKQMNKLPVTAQERDDIVTEANHVFELNMHMFEELDNCAGLLEKDKKLPMIPGWKDFTPVQWLLISFMISILIALWKVA